MQTPVSAKNKKDRPLPYGRQAIDEDDIRSVVDILRSDWLTTGPQVALFEKAVSDFTGATEGVAVSSGTAALHSAMFAMGIQSGDEVILSPMTFAATANAVVYQGGIPVFADIHSDTLLLDPADVASKITARTKAVIAVDYAGQPCEYEVLSQIADLHHLVLAADACHSLGAAEGGKKVGQLADLTVFSFHPVKPITTGEGGMVVTSNAEYADRMRRFRNHGITSDHHQRANLDTWVYEMTDLGFNYRMTDFQCALGISQLNKLPRWIHKRRKIADRYNDAFAHFPWIKALRAREHASHAYHLYVVQLALDALSIDRADVFSRLRSKGIGVNVHYLPVYLHPFYRNRFGFKPGLCPRAEAAYERIISLPMYPLMSGHDCERTINEIKTIEKMQAA